MKFNIWLLCGVVATCQVYAADDMYLEGISSVGKQRVAYVLMNDTKFSLKEGERLTRWKVTKIGQRSVILADAKGSETELVLHNRTPSEPAPPETAVENPQPTEKAKTPETQPSNEDVPKGYRKVKTPFGEVVIQEDTTKPTQETQPAPPPPPDAPPPATPPKEEPKDDEVRPGYHKVRTPFGDIWIEDKKNPSADKDAKKLDAATK